MGDPNIPVPTWPPQSFVPVPAAFEQGHCYEPYVKYGNFTASDPRYPVGTTVEFSCDPGYTLEQGSTIIECVDPNDPQWNETEPACRGGCWCWRVPGGHCGWGVRDTAATVLLSVMELRDMVGAGCGWDAGVGGCPTAVPSLACAHSGVQRGADGHSWSGAVTQLARGVRQRPGLHLGAACGGGQAHHAGRPCVSAGMGWGWWDGGSVPSLPSRPHCPRLRLGSGDMLTFYDGDDLTARILGQYTGARGRFKLYASTADVTVQFQSDPGAGAFAYRQGFVIHFSGEAHGGTVPPTVLSVPTALLSLLCPQRFPVMTPALSCRTLPMAGRRPHSQSFSMALW